jgi:hypothetical protein
MREQGNRKECSAQGFTQNHNQPQSMWGSCEPLCTVN